MQSQKHVHTSHSKQMRWEQSPLVSTWQFGFFFSFFFLASWLSSRSFTPYPAVLLPKQLWWNFNRSIHCKANSVSLPRPQQTDNTVYSVLSYPVKIGQVTAQSKLCQHMRELLRTHPHNPCSHIHLHTPNWQHYMFTLMLTYCTFMSGVHADRNTYINIGSLHMLIANSETWDLNPSTVQHV